MHIARHTFGNISGDRIPIQMLQKLYRHSSVTTTINYQANFMKKEADTALDKVINFLVLFIFYGIKNQIILGLNIFNFFFCKH
ncbi:tyrosine type site-specific recombinase [Galbibacter marinus]|uniref:Tyrosine type site-specific recombinase n=1 Tax=Galbibacter marinus TaxID=555500 RepID=K2QIF1_9FLAO|nr:tyrosine type site-specific recombinase [Galbibacter marinus]